MLVLTRRVGETTKVSGEIEVTVLAVRGGQVRLGWKAPSHVNILREEIWREETHRASRRVLRHGSSRSSPG